MGLLYNNKKKTDIVVLSEEELENPEGQMCDFVLLPEDESASNDNVEDNKND